MLAVYSIIIGSFYIWKSGRVAFKRGFQGPLFFGPRINEKEVRVKVAAFNENLDFCSR